MNTIGSRRISLWLLLVTAAGVTCPTLASAQVPLASIRGTILDPSGAALGEARLIFRQASTGLERPAASNGDGVYQVESLDPGEYQMEISRPGFRDRTYQVSLRSGDNKTVNVKLEVLPLSSAVTIEEISGVNTSDFPTGIVTRSQIEELPLNGRNYLELARLEPAVSVTSVANPGAFGNNFQRVSIAGNSYLETRIAVDGSTVDDRINGGTALNVSQESVQEFQISTFNFDLTTGTTGTGAINIVSRRGTNDVHGSLFFFYRDNELAAYPALRRDPRQPDPFFARRQSGFSLGGPISKDRFFWFGNYEHHNQDGVFAVANNHPIFSKLDAVHSSPLDANLLTLRFDGRLNSRFSAFVRHSLDFNNSIAPSGTAISMPSNWFSGRTKAGQTQVGLTSILTSQLIGDFRISYGYLNNVLDALTVNECRTASCIGISGPDIGVFDAPSFRIGHHVTVPKTMDTRTLNINSNFTWQKGAHRIRFGGEWEHLNLNSIHKLYDPPQINLWGPTDLLRSSTLRPLYDALPATLKDPAAGPPTLDDILQLPLRSFVIGIGNPMQPGPYHHDQFSTPDLVRLYFNNGWTLRPGLNLTYGMASLWRTDIYNQDLQRPAYLAPLLGSDLRPPYRGTTNLEPRLGFVWSVRENGETVLRAGASLHHDDINFFRPYLERGTLGPAGNGRVAVDGAITGYSFPSVPTAFAGKDLLPLLPGIQTALNGKLGDGTNPAITSIEVIKQGDRIFDPSHRTPSAIHVTAGIQQKLTPKLVISANYVARRFLHFGGFQAVYQLDRNRFNRPRVTNINPGTGEVSFVRDPVIRQCSSLEAAALAPADQCSTGPINVYGSGASYLYQGLHVKLEGRLASRLHLTASYAFSHNDGFVEFSDYDDHATAYGNQADDRHHRLTVSAVYDIPAYRGRFGFARRLLSRWRVSLISQTDSAPPLNTLLAGLDLDGDGISRTLLPGTTKHNTLGDGLSVSELRDLVDRYNADVEAQTRRITNADGSVTVVRPRTPFNQVINPIVLPQEFSGGDSFISQNVRLTRNLRLSENTTLSLIGEVFNAFNVANLTGYSNIINQVNYGQPSSRAGQVFGSGGPRAFQFAARLQF